MPILGVTSRSCAKVIAPARVIITPVSVTDRTVEAGPSGNSPPSKRYAEPYFPLEFNVGQALSSVYTVKGVDLINAKIQLKKGTTFKVGRTTYQIVYPMDACHRRLS